MHPDYRDITSRIKDPPVWYMGNGVPRYAPFKPHMVSIYARMSMLVEIECQNCPKRFLVGDDYSGIDWTTGNTYTLRELAEGFHYGDPPAHGCVGDTMNCIDVRIMEAWQHGANGAWYRVPDIEAIDIMQGWAKGP